MYYKSFFLLFVCFVLVTLFFPITASAQTTWTRQFGTSGQDIGTAVATDTTGIYTVGYTSGSFPGETNAGSYDVYVRKYDFSGNIVWTHQLGTSDFDQTWSIVAVNNSVYVAGHLYPNGFLRKYDQNGNEVWTHTFDFGHGLTYAMGVASDGTSLYVASMTTGAITGQVNAGNYDVVVQKEDFDGNIIWERQFGSAGADQTNGIAVNNTGVYVDGFTRDSLLGQINAGNSDAFIKKYDLDGNDIWTHEFGTAGEDFGNGIAIDSTGVYVSGTTNDSFPGQTNIGNYDAFLRKYDFSGSEVWTREFGTSGPDEARGAYANAQGVYISGYQQNNAFVRIYDTVGNVQNTYDFIPSSDAVGYGVTADNSYFYTTGLVDGNFEGETSSGSTDAYLIKQSILPSPQLTALTPAKVWIGVKNITDIGIKLDLLAEVYAGGTLVSSGEVTSFSPASGLGGFGSAHLATIPFNSFTSVDFPSGTSLQIKLSVRNACTGSLRAMGTARLWYNDSQANSQFGSTVGSSTNDYFLKDGFVLSTTAGTGPKKTIDVEAGARCSAFKPFGIWTTTP
ncbi:MAG TPA: SBBP repeat-containing protein [Methylomirabilota bacterium]|nr:SBBP repeat-containing protein [Methylomirabilota bacterium]